MSGRTYIGLMTSLLTSVWFVPDFAELLKVYVVTASVLTAAVVTVLFQWRRLRDEIVNDIVIRVMMDPDVQKLIQQRLQRMEFRKRVKKIIEEKRNGEQNRTR